VDYVKGGAEGRGWEVCGIRRGAVLESYGLERDPRGILAGLVGCTVVYRGLAFGVVWGLRWRR